MHMSGIETKEKVVGNNIHTSVYDKSDDFGFPIFYFPWMNGDMP